MKRIAFLMILLYVAVGSLFAAITFEPFVETEQGTIAILHHTYENGKTAGSGTNFDFRNEGGQDLLYPFERYAIGATINGRHRAWFTYQPLNLVTNVTFRENVTVGKEEGNPVDTALTFVAGTPMELTYSFPFYRFSYTYDVLGKHEHATLGLGLVLQIRDASIRFKALDDTKGLFVSQNVGLVPALAIYSSYEFPFGLRLSADIAGSYASSSFFNGADFDFTGSILDASLRMGYTVKDELELFGNLRFFGGTAEGTSDAETSWSVSSYNYTKNNIAALTVSVGALWSM